MENNSKINYALFSALYSNEPDEKVRDRFIKILGDARLYDINNLPDYIEEGLEDAYIIESLDDVEDSHCSHMCFPHEMEEETEEGNFCHEDITIPEPTSSDIKRHVHILIDVAMRERNFNDVVIVRRFLEAFNRMDNHLVEAELPRLDAYIDSLDEYLKQKDNEHNKIVIGEKNFAEAIDNLMLALDEQGNNIFSVQRHWIAVFRVAVDYHLIGDKDYEGFCDFIHRIHPASFRIPLKKADLKQIAMSDCYFKPFKQWRFSPIGNVKISPYNKMVKVVNTFLELLNLK